MLHVNATAYGGGVSELLRSTVPLLNDIGLVAHWQVIGGDDAFFNVTKALHNALQGGERELTSADQRTYLEIAERNASELADQRYDFVFIHDPQPAPLRQMRPDLPGRWIWRCHIDTSAPQAGAWDLLRPFLADYDAAIFTLEEFLPPGLPLERVDLVPPAIDPASPKNLTLPESTARQILEWIGLRLDRPLICQVSRFDPWKDPLGVIAAYRQVREELPEVELVLAGSMALDDPEGFEIYGQLMRESEKDPQIHVFTNLTGVGNIEVNALQRLSDVIVQKSIREGFGLVVSEALWKGTPVVGGHAGGIPLQMADGTGGMLVRTVEECAGAIVELLGDPGAARSLGESGRQRVREHFLLPRLLLNEVSLMLDLAEGRPLGELPGADSARRDPVCGMAIEVSDAAAIDAEYGGKSFVFCSQACRARFQSDPERYARGLVGLP